MRSLILRPGSELAEHCGATEIPLEVRSPAEAIRALLLEYPGSRAIIERGAWRVKDASAWVESDWGLEVTRSEAAIELVPVAEGAGDSGIGKIFAGIFIAILGVVTGGFALPLLGFLSTGTLVGIGASIALSGVARMMAPTPQARPMDLEEANARHHSLFASPTTLREGGQAVPLAYGRSRVGGLRVGALAYHETAVHWQGGIGTGDRIYENSPYVDLVDIVGEGTIGGLVDGKNSVFSGGQSIDTLAAGSSGQLFVVSELTGAAGQTGAVVQSTRTTRLQKDVTILSPASATVTSTDTKVVRVVLAWDALYTGSASTPPENREVEFELLVNGNAAAAGMKPEFMSTGTSTFTWEIGDPVYGDPGFSFWNLVWGALAFPDSYSMSIRPSFQWLSTAGAFPPPAVLDVVVWYKPFGQPIRSVQAPMATDVSSYTPGNNYTILGQTIHLPWEGSVTSCIFWIDTVDPAERPWRMNVQREQIWRISGEPKVDGVVVQGPYLLDIELDDLAQYGSAPYEITVKRVTPELTSTYSRDAFRLEQITEVIPLNLELAGTAAILASGPAGAISADPALTYEINGRLVSVPTGFDPVAGTFASPWDGTFKAVPEFTSDPAWVLWDILTDDRAGLGIDSARLDRWSFAAASRRNLESVPNLSTLGGLERRYEWNGVITRADDGYKVAAQVAALMDAQLWVSTAGVLYLGQDAPGLEVSRIFHSGNVIGGSFNYEGAASTARRSSATAKYRDAELNYELAIERQSRVYSEARFGARHEDLEAPGVTSRGQAIRRARHLVITDEMENQLVRFQVGLENALVQPGEIVEIADNHRAQFQNGSRINSVYPLAGTLYIGPFGDTDWAANYTPNVTLARWATTSGAIGVGTVSLVWNGLLVIAGSAQWSDPVAPGAPIMLTSSTPETWRVLEVADDGEGLFSIMAVRYAPEKWAAIEDDTDLGEPFPFPSDPWPPV